VFGLRRAFVLAGAKTLVISLWKVPDQQTQELMEEFYQRLIQGTPRAEALRHAQLALKARYPNPLYWGAFICQGDPAPLGGLAKLPGRAPQTASKQSWYYSLDGEPGQGPITSAQMKELVRTGKLQRTDKVSRDGRTWHAASQLQGVEWPA
jgi:hypothetical protein